jgi:hypothetical protein
VSTGWGCPVLEVGRAFQGGKSAPQGNDVTDDDYTVLSL